MQTLLLVRHAESAAIASGVAVRFDDDSALSDNGVRQVGHMRRFLRDVCPAPDLVLTSRLTRARQTAALLFPAPTPSVADAGLNEFRLGPNGEGLETTEAGLVRAMRCLNDHRLANGTVAVVAHNAILSVLRMSLLNGPWDANHDAFGLPGTCRLLRYDPGSGDQAWGERTTFSPSVPTAAAG